MNSIKSLAVFEFEKVVEEKSGSTGMAVPKHVFAWLTSQCIRRDTDAPGWIKLTQLNGQQAIQFMSYVGIVRAPCGFQIEILPKTGKDTSQEQARALLIDMLKCLAGFRHIHLANADLLAVQMPLLEVFIQQFLMAVSHLVKRGIRNDYSSRQDNISILRGRLIITKQISQNSARKDRFFTEFDEYIQDRPENRLIHAALRQVLRFCRAKDNQRVARGLSFVFAEVPISVDVAQDIQRIRLDRGMSYYEPALVWAKLILKGLSPIYAAGMNNALSLLFPMEAIFEAFVEKHLARQLRSSFTLKGQPSSQYLVTHDTKQWFRLRPDLLVMQQQKICFVLDTKWKLLNAAKNNGQEKYQLSQADFYQLYAYGHHYLNGSGNVVLIYPLTNEFVEPLPVFDFPKSFGMRLWVLPFCLNKRRLKFPNFAAFQLAFND